MTSITTFPELAAFLMLYVARVDGNAHYLEEATLSGQLKTFTEDNEALLHRISSAYPKIEDEKIEVVLKAYEDLIRSASPEQRKQLIESLFAIVNSDGKVRSEEMETLRVIRGAIDNIG